MATRRANGEGSVHHNPKTKAYEWKIPYVDPETGIKKTRKISGKIQKEVMQRGKEFREKMKKAREEVLANHSEAETVEGWLYEWLDKYMKNSLKVTTYERYKCSIQNHIVPYIGSIHIDKLTAEDVQNMMNDLLDTGGKNQEGLAPRTINSARRTLMESLDKACHLRKLDYNPVNATKAFTTEKPEIRVLTREEAKDLLKVAKEYDQTAYMAILFALSTGMRIGEIFGLTWANVDIDAKLLYVKQSLVSTNHGPLMQSSTKTKAGNRQIPLPQHCSDVLQGYRTWQKEQKARWSNQYKNNDLVIANPDGGYKDPSRFSYVIFKRLLAAAGIDTSVRFHDLRHTHATRSKWFPSV